MPGRLDGLTYLGDGMASYANNLLRPAASVFLAAGLRLLACPFAVLGVWAFRVFTDLELAAGRAESVA